MNVNPMLAKASVPFDNPNWLYEIKWDGERVIAFIESEKIVRLQNRNNVDVSKVFPEVLGTHVNASTAILDGEMVVFNGDGMPSFKKLAQRAHLQDRLRIELLSKNMPATYVPFDVIMRNDAWVSELPLIKRKEILSSMVHKDNGSLLPTFFVEGNGQEFFNAVVGMGYEGIMAKRMNGRYLMGKRSDSWLKMKPKRSAVCQITGYTKGNGHREQLGALLIEQDGTDRGRVGSGIKDSDVEGLVDRIKQGEKLNITVSYFEITEAGHFRNPVFKGIVQ